MFKVGKVTHYFDKLSVAIIDLDGTLSVNDNVKFVKGGDTILEQKVDSIQIAHEKKDSAGKGDVIGLKTQKPVREGYEVYKV